MNGRNDWHLLVVKVHNATRQVNVVLTKNAELEETVVTVPMNTVQKHAVVFHMGNNAAQTVHPLAIMSVVLTSHFVSRDKWGAVLLKGNTARRNVVVSWETNFVARMVLRLLDHRVVLARFLVAHTVPTRTTSVLVNNAYRQLLDRHLRHLCQNAKETKTAKTEPKGVETEGTRSVIRALTSADLAVRVALAFVSEMIVAHQHPSVSSTAKFARME
mmetsp:Transcript_13221/g.20147  ORF Transcript_13221/g.20147 Transcript_13221/m.20147 type:complete len:216 (+) Transcript_13221:1204-1851(+)